MLSMLLAQELPFSQINTHRNYDDFSLLLM